MPHRALITGISGFAGGFLAEHLLEAADAVLGCCPDGKWLETSSQALPGRVELLAWDIAQPGEIPNRVRQAIDRFRPDCIYHLAALSVPEDCGAAEPAPSAAAINILGTRRVLQLASRLASRPRVLFASSSHVYAPVSPESPRVDESAPLRPRSAYGQTKLAAEGEVCQAVREQGSDALIARSFPHTGPRQNPRMMLPQWARQFAAGGSQPVRILTRDARIDVTDVRDVVRAYRLLMERGRRGEVYNVGSGVCRTSGEIFELLHQMADPRRTIVELQPGFKQDPIADISRLVQCTGWQPQIPLETTVADTLAWWRWYQSRTSSQR